MPWKEKEISGARLSFVACGGAFNEKSTRVLVTRTRPPEFSLIFSTRMSHDFTTRKGRRNNNNTKNKTKKEVKKNHHQGMKKTTRARSLDSICNLCVVLCRPTFGFRRRSEWEMSRVDGMMDHHFPFCFHLFNIQHRRNY